MKAVIMLGTGGVEVLTIGDVTKPMPKENQVLVRVMATSVIGSVLRSRPVAEKGAIVAEFTKRVLPKFADGTIVPLIEKVFPLDDVIEAHRMMEEDRHFGKIVLQVAS